LFEGGAGETVRKKLLETTDVHSILSFTHRHLLCEWCEGKCCFLRQQTFLKRSMDKRDLVL
jgi:hypothetical protein